MKYDEYDNLECEAKPVNNVSRNLKKKRNISILDVAILQVIFCVMIAMTVLVGRLIGASVNTSISESINWLSRSVTEFFVNTVNLFK